MNTEELTEFATASHGLAMAQAGKVAALASITEALIATVGLAFPPLLAELEQHLNHLQALQRATLEEDSLAAFDQQIRQIRELSGALQGS